jgi:hypothetical protein
MLYGIDDGVNPLGAGLDIDHPANVTGRILGVTILIIDQRNLNDVTYARTEVLDQLVSKLLVDFDGGAVILEVAPREDMLAKKLALRLETGRGELNIALGVPAAVDNVCAHDDSIGNLFPEELNS